MQINTKAYDFEVDAIYPCNVWDTEKGGYGDEPQLDSETGWRQYQLTVTAYLKEKGAADRGEKFKIYLPFETEPAIGRHAPIEFERLGYYVTKNGRVVYQPEGVKL